MSMRMLESLKGEVSKTQVDNLAESIRPVDRLHWLSPQTWHSVLRVFVILQSPVRHVGCHPPIELGLEHLPHLKYT